MTVLIWTYPTNAGGGAQDVMRRRTGDGYNIRMRIDSGEMFIQQFGNSGWEGPSTSVENTAWMQWAVTVDADTGSLTAYKNGESFGSVTTEFGDSNDAGWTFGTYPAGGDRYDGRLDEILVYDRTLSSQEVQDLYFNGKPFTGDYEHSVDTGAVNNWTTFYVDASVPADTSVEATVEALDSSGEVGDMQTVSLSTGAMNYSLTVQDSEDARIRFSGTSSNVEKTWSVMEATVYYNR